MRSGTCDLGAGIPTGNGRIVAVAPNHVVLDREIRDSTGERWYWHIWVSRRETLTVEMARPALLGGFGPAISVDGGRSFSWLWDSYRGQEVFELPAASTGANLAATLPYGLMSLSRFVAGLDRAVEVRQLATSERGRSVPMLRLRPPKPPRHRLVVTARHHACEAVGSLVFEGLMLGVRQLQASGNDLALALDVIAIPMMDIDGVTSGDQGKAREPHDHNRDYGRVCRYSSVRGLRRAQLLGDLPTVALDLHTPGLRGPVEEKPFVVASGDPGDAERVAEFAAACDDQGDRLPVIVFDEDWNSTSSRGPRCFAAWARSHEHVSLAATVEYPNAVIRGCPVTAPGARQFGRGLAAALPHIFV